MLVSTPTNINKFQIKEDLGRCVQLHGGEMACQVKFDSFRRKNTGKFRVRDTWTSDTVHAYNVSSND